MIETASARAKIFAAIRSASSAARPVREDYAAIPTQLCTCRDDGRCGAPGGCLSTGCGSTTPVCTLQPRQRSPFHWRRFLRARRETAHACSPMIFRSSGCPASVAFTTPGNALGRSRTRCLRWGADCVYGSDRALRERSCCRMRRDKDRAPCRWYRTTICAWCSRRRLLKRSPRLSIF